MKLGLCIDWKKVDSHMKKVRSRPRLEIDPECLRWTPLLAPTVNPFRSPDADISGDQDTETEDTEMKAESEETEPETVISNIESEEKVATELNDKKETIEITSSGRRRTRPLKYSETTYQTTAGDSNRRRRRDTIRKLSESNTEEDKDHPALDEPTRRQRSKSVTRQSTHTVTKDNNSPVLKNRRQSVKESVYNWDSQEEAPLTIAETPHPIRKAKRKLAWKGKPRKRQRTNKKQDGMSAQKTDLNEETETNDFKMDEDSVESQSILAEFTSINENLSETNKDNNPGSSEDSSGEADDEMDVEEGEDRNSVASKPATPHAHEENSTDNHTSDMELDSIHMDSPKSMAEKEETQPTDEENPKAPNDITTTTPVVENELVNEGIIKESDEQNVPVTTEMKSPTKPVIDDKETIIISESDDNNSQSCPLPSPKLNMIIPVTQTNEKPKEVEENESPSKVIPVVSTENAHIVLDAKIHDDKTPTRSGVDLIVPKMPQIETIIVEGESDTANSPQAGISPKKSDKIVINESPTIRKSPEKDTDCENNKTELRKETVIQHQMAEDKKSPNKSDSIIQNLDHQREAISQYPKKPEIYRTDAYLDIDLNKRIQAQVPITRENEVNFRNESLNTRKDEPILNRNIIESNMQTFQNPLNSLMALQQPQFSYMNHRPITTKESQAVQTDKNIKTSENNKLMNNFHSDTTPVISKPPTKLEIPNPITSPVINPVIPKVPNINMTDVNFLPRCQSANAAVNLGLERNDIDTNFVNSNALQNSLGGSMNIVQNLQDKMDPNAKPREKSKLREVRVNSAHSKLEKNDKKNAKTETPRSTPEPKMFVPEVNAGVRKPDTSVPINVINTAPITSKADTKTAEAPKKQDFFKKEKTNANKCDNKNSVKHDKNCTTQQKADQNDLNKMLPKFKYDNELVAKADYAMNQIPNYHTTHAQYQWPHWDPARLQGTWDQHRFLDMKNTDKNYLDKFQGFNLPHLDQMQKSPQKLHQKDFHNIAYGALSAGGIYATTGLPHFKETAAKPPVSKASECHQKSECKPTKQSKSGACQTQCDSKKNQNEQIKQMMQRQIKQDGVTNCGDYRQSPQIMTSPGCKNYQNGPCEKTDIEKKSRKKDESPKEKEEMCEAASPALQSMGVYTPDSTSNSVHSVQYAACELDVSQLGLESPSSIGSDMASPCSMMHMHPAPSPQYPHSSIHLPAIMTQPNQPHKQKNINNRNRLVSNNWNLNGIIVI